MVYKKSLIKLWKKIDRFRIQDLVLTCDEQDNDMRKRKKENHQYHTDPKLDFMC